jgi:hypothetical protein
MESTELLKQNNARLEEVVKNSADEISKVF